MNNNVFYAFITFFLVVITGGLSFHVYKKQETTKTLFRCFHKPSCDMSIEASSLLQSQMANDINFLKRILHSEVKTLSIKEYFVKNCKLQSMHRAGIDFSSSNIHSNGELFLEFNLKNNNVIYLKDASSIESLIKDYYCLLLNEDDFHKANTLELKQ